MAITAAYTITGMGDWSCMITSVCAPADMWPWAVLMTLRAMGQ
jgi:hypothetical protein